MTIGKRLFLIFGVMFTVALAVIGLSLEGFRSLGATINKLVAVNIRKEHLAADLNTSMAAMTASERAILLRAYMKDPVAMETHRKGFAEAMERANKDLTELEPMIETASGRQMLGDIQVGLRNIQQFHEEHWNMVTSVKLENAAALYDRTLVPAGKEVNDTIQRFQLLEGKLVNDVWRETESTLFWSRGSVITGGIACLCLFPVMLFMLRQANQGLRRAVAELFEGAAQMSGAAAQVSSASQSLAQGSSEQAASLEETSASTEEINSMARKNNENSRSAADMVTQSQQKFSEAKGSLDQMVVAMGEINTQSDKISKIIKVIDEIAFQTNILALNAAVEAARAGEAGMGFAVVADEVRSLAQRCSRAARDTAGLIEESIAKSNDGKTKVDLVASAIRAVTGEVGQAKTLVEEVNLSSREQATGIEQIGKAISQMERVTQQTAASAEESAAAAEELTAQSDALKDVANRLKIMVDGKTEPAASPAVQSLARPAAVPRKQPALSLSERNESAFPLDRDF